MPDKPHIYQQWSVQGVWYRLSDALCIAGGLAVAVGHGLTTTVDQYVLAAAVAIIVYYLLAEMGGLYRSWRGVSTHREAVAVLFGWGCTLVVLLAIGFVTNHTGEFSRISMFAWFVDHARNDPGQPHRHTSRPTDAAVGGLQDAKVRHRGRQ